MKILSTIYRYLMLLSYLIGRFLGAILYGAKKFNSSLDTHSLPTDHRHSIEQRYPAPSPLVSPNVPSAEELESIRYVTVIREREMHMQMRPVPSVSRFQQQMPDYDYDKPFRNTLSKYNDDGRFNMRWL